MGVGRLDQIPGFSIDRVAAAAGEDPDVLRLENLDTDIPPPAEAVEATRAAVGRDETNSWLPFTGRDDLKESVARYIERRGGPAYDGRREIVITSGEGDAMLDALFCLTDPTDEVILTDPTYAGMLNRVRLVGAVPRLVPLRVVDGEWRLDLDALSGAVSERTRVVFINNASFPTGWVASAAEWDAIAELCRERDLWLLYWAGFEGVLYDGLQVIHPAALPGMRDRTVTIGAASLELRMIAWRVGWVVCPGDLVNDVSRVQIYNGLTPSGFAQVGVRVGLDLGDEQLIAANVECQRRREETLRQRGRGRCCSTHASWGSSRPSCRLAFCSTRWPPRRWPAGAATWPRAICASCSATSPSSAWRYSAIASAPPSPKRRSAGERCRQAILNQALDAFDRHAVLGHRVAVAHGDRAVLERIDVDRDAPRRADLVLPAVELTDPVSS
jgi:aspartate/methionine/tyrosine aminotransferase